MSRRATLGGWTRGGAALAAATLAMAMTAGPVRAQSNLDVEFRGGLAVPVGDLSDVGDPGGGFGAGLGWWVSDRIAARFDVDLEAMSEDLAGGVIMPKSYLWHVHAGLELSVWEPADAPWVVRARGGGGATVYDTEPFFEGGDDFLDTYFSVSGGLQIGYAITRNIDVGVLGQVFIMYADKDRTAEFAQRSASVHPFAEASSFPIELYLSWTPN